MSGSQLPVTLVPGGFDTSSGHCRYVRITYTHKPLYMQTLFLKIQRISILGSQQDGSVGKRACYSVQQPVLIPPGLTWRKQRANYIKLPSDLLMLHPPPRKEKFNIKKEECLYLYSAPGSMHPTIHIYFLKNLDIMRALSM